MIPILVCSTEIHSWSVVVLIINNVHSVESEILLIVLDLLLNFRNLLDNDDIILSFFGDRLLSQLLELCCSLFTLNFIQH